MVLMYFRLSLANPDVPSSWSASEAAAAAAKAGPGLRMTSMMDLLVAELPELEFEITEEVMEPYSSASSPAEIEPRRLLRSPIRW